MFLRKKKKKKKNIGMWEWNVLWIWNSLWFCLAARVYRICGWESCLAMLCFYNETERNL